MAHNLFHKGNPNPVVKKTTTRPFGAPTYGTPTTVRTGPTQYTTTTPFTQKRQSTGVTYQEAYNRAGGSGGTGMSFPGFKKAAIAYNTKTGSVVSVRNTPKPVAINFKPSGPVSSMTGKSNPLFKISAGPSPITSTTIKKQPPPPKPKKKRKPFRPFGYKPFNPGGTFSNIGRGIGYAAGDVGRTVGNVAVGAVTLPFKAIGSIFKGGCGRGKCNPMAKNIFGQRRRMRR